jgi:N-acetylmuramoyl-L-alanine amidase
MKRALMLSMLLVFLINSGEAARKITVKGIRSSSNDNHARIVVDVDGPIKYTSSRLSDPDRLYFDLEDCKLSGNVKASIPINNGIIEAVRTSQFNMETVRVVLDIPGLDSFSSFTLSDPNRLVIDVNSRNPLISPKNKIRKNKKFIGVRRVVIDAGHGGKDPGATGPGRLREKDVVLDIAKRLGKILREDNGLEVIYTRDKDLFVPLNERTEIANSNGADLFISIHVNASRRRKARGIETYFLNWTNNKEASRVAARENRITFKKMQKVQGDLQMILLDLARDNKSRESKELAFSIQNSIVSNLKKNYRRIEDHKVKWALFYVLIGAQMPSVLVETSFISNHEEEKRLSTAKYRGRIAEAIAIGISDYIRKSTLIVKIPGENAYYDDSASLTREMHFSG